MSEAYFAEAIFVLTRAGWTVWDAGFTTEAGACLWFVIGHNGENLIRAVGPTRNVAWRRAVEQAKVVGMLGRLPGQRRAADDEEAGQAMAGGEGHK